MSSGIGNIPTYIKAKSPRGLRRLMFETNLKYKLTIEYHNIQFANKYWYAWFYIAPEDILDDIAE